MNIGKCIVPALIAAAAMVLPHTAGATTNFAAPSTSIQNQITDLDDGVYDFEDLESGSHFEIPVKSGVIDGVMKQFTLNKESLVAEVPYQKGEKNGLAKRYNGQGRMLISITFKNGIQDGNTTAYYPNGEMHYVMPYRNGKPHGEAVMYGPDGREKRATFNDGVKVSG